MSSEDLSRITLWGINNGYEENASNQAATIFNRQFAKRKPLYCREKMKKDKNRTLLDKVAGSNDKHRLSEPFRVTLNEHNMHLLLSSRNLQCLGSVLMCKKTSIV
jgi:hypothetical protein